MLMLIERADRADDGGNDNSNDDAIRCDAADGAGGDSNDDYSNIDDGDCNKKERIRSLLHMFFL